MDKKRSADGAFEAVAGNELLHRRTLLVAALEAPGWPLRGRRSAPANFLSSYG